MTTSIFPKKYMLPWFGLLVFIYWYGEKPRILKAHKGTGVDELIVAVNKAAEDYPWKDTYRAFPGPNSNTYTAWIAKQVPKLELTLPFSAIGSGYLE